LSRNLTLFPTRIPLYPALCCRTLPYNHFARTTQKTASTVNEACLLIRCLAIEVLLLRALAPAGMCLPSSCLAIGLRVTVLSTHLRLRLPGGLLLLTFPQILYTERNSLRKLQRNLVVHQTSQAELRTSAYLVIHDAIFLSSVVTTVCIALSNT
jgi:hypothetical protein